MNAQRENFINNPMLKHKCKKEIITCVVECQKEKREKKIVTRQRYGITWRAWPVGVL